MQATVPGAQEYALLPSYPNPFNPSTTIKFTLPVDATVKLTIYDVLGREVVTLVDDYIEAGSHSAIWDARSSGRTLSSGFYFMRLEASDLLGRALYTKSGKLLLTK
jgi:hypothetical protein